MKGIEKYQWHEYEPVSRTNLNSAGEIRINIETQDLFCHPSESYLLIEGRLVKADGTAYVNANAISITNNGLMHLFSQISYSLSNQDNGNGISSGASNDDVRFVEISGRFRKSARPQPIVVQRYNRN